MGQLRLTTQRPYGRIRQLALQDDFTITHQISGQRCGEEHKQTVSNSEKYAKFAKFFTIEIFQILGMFNFTIILNHYYYHYHYVINVKFEFYQCFKFYSILNANVH